MTSLDPLQRRQPCIGALVRDLAERHSIGEVTAIRVLGTSEPGIEILWHKHASKRDRTLEVLGSLGNAFCPRMQVEHVPDRPGRVSLGMGEIASARTLGRREQLLVDFWASGQRFWLPYEHFRIARGVEQRFRQGVLGPAGDAERLRLRCLAHALELWNENSGALSRFDIDPLPHQIHLVHRILASGHLNWMIADDVGLGKTIEVGMLLAALRQRDHCRRILLVTPPGLTVQWQEELHQKFQIGDFQIYGRDFEVHDVRHWKLHDHVIASIDRLKQDEDMRLLLQAGRWDLIVFDEAHRLSRRQYGSKYEYSQRFALAARLRDHADHLLLLTATPHQGMSDKFQALLELIRPDLKNEIQLLDLRPQILGDIIIRNRKDQVTDAEGNLIFKGKKTHAVAVPVSEEARRFDEELQRYLQRGRQAGEQAQGVQQRAIGFVMNAYRKLAASSAAAIHAALRGRRERLAREYDWQSSEVADEPFAEHDARYAGEYEERAAGTARQFFEGEIALLDEMIERAERLLDHDSKQRMFVEQMTRLLQAHDTDGKVLIFTEYRATQSYLRTTLEKQFGAGCVELIHGGQKSDERRTAIRRFEEGGQFLISTEAGGEGINLQRRCHILVNYDLPWNPMRLVQRIGRLYRYGQSKPVLVFNMHAPDSLDGSIISLLYQRLEQIVRDMASVGTEFRAGLEDEILGQMVELLDIEEILENSGRTSVQRTQAEIEDALARARHAAELQSALFEHVSGYQREDAKGELAVDRAHLEAFVRGMLRQLGGSVLREIHEGRELEIEVPESLREQIPGWRHRERVTFERRWVADRTGVRVLDLDADLIQAFLLRAKEYRFGGWFSRVRNLEGEALAAAILRWQNAQGVRMRQELIAVQLHTDGRAVHNTAAFSNWLLTPAEDGICAHELAKASTLLELARVSTDRRLAQMSSSELHPENRQWIAAGWIG